MFYPNRKPSNELLIYKHVRQINITCYDLKACKRVCISDKSSSSSSSSSGSFLATWKRKREKKIKLISFILWPKPGLIFPVLFLIEWEEKEKIKTKAHFPAANLFRALWCCWCSFARCCWRWLQDTQFSFGDFEENLNR